MPGYSTFFEGVIFIEGMEPDSKTLGLIRSDLSFKIGAQLKNLNDVKHDLSTKARNMGANAVLNFTYGQKSRWLAIDDVAYFGEGIAAILTDQRYKEVMEKIANR
ncbi:MAG TPA: hypothetical protein DC024_06280 [Clostridiales bacterium]|jgi:hypothetical protein|nr:hypothetical protein [Clostridiales bacterium]